MISTEQQQHISTHYTLIPIVDPSHQAKLQAYMSQPTQTKTSLCRFYLRGLCIMKPQHCKFAHKFEQIDLSEDEWELIKTSSYDEKQRKKIYFQLKQDFQQKPLFFIKYLDFYVLYDYQSEQKWKQSPNSKKFHSIEEIRDDRELRHKIRQVLHRQNWSKLIDFLIKTFTKVDFSISFLSKWFSKVGFQKPQTRCKFGDFMRYMISVKNFKQVNIIIPPRLQKTVFFVNCNKQNQNTTYLFENIGEIEEIHIQAKEEYKKEMLIKLQPLSEQLRKRFICRYFMAGNCQYSQEDCKYAHSITALKFQVGQAFEPRHKQFVKGRQQRLNYISLHKYSVSKISPDITLQDLNANSNFRQQYRKTMHYELYSQFMLRLQQLTGQKYFKKGFIQQQYNGAGFNHSEENKFGQFEARLFDIGYVVEDLKLEGENGGKSTYVYKIPPIKQLDEYFAKYINIILEEQVQAIKKAQILAKILQPTFQQPSNQIQQQYTQISLPQLTLAQSTQHQQKQVILQSSFRKKLYRVQTPFSVPLHVYLRIKASTLQQAIKDLTIDKTLLEHIFFQTNQQNYKKLIQLSKQYFKNSKQYLHKLDQIQLYIKSYHKDQINLNSNVTLKSFLQPALIDAGKKVYSLKFGSNTFVIDRGNLPGHEKTVIKGKYLLKNYASKDQNIIAQLNENPFSKERIIIVENQLSYEYAQIFLSNCNKLGVDLQGRLKKDGYIDLIQVSSIFNNQKQIFVFDVFWVKKLQDQSLYQRMVSFLKLLFEDPSRVKILHDCKQDSTALKYLMGIELKNVFDTSGMNIVLEQKQVYEKWDKKNQTSHHVLKRTFDVKVPGLNTVLQKWGAPNGVNIFKQSMKKRFHEDGPRSYFEQRPIDLEFLEYSAQDVQDLVDIYQAMKKQDTDKLSEAIGEIYSTIYMLNEE